MLCSSFRKLNLAKTLRCLSTRDLIKVQRKPTAADIEDILNKKHLISINGTSKVGVLGLDHFSYGDSLSTSVDNAITKCRGKVEQIKKETDSSPRTIELVDELVEQISEITDLSAFLAQSASVSSEKRIEAAAALAKAHSFILTINADKEVYTKLQDLSHDKISLNEIQEEGREVLKKLLLEFQSNGIDLKEEDRNTLQKLKKEIAIIGTEFLRESVAPTLIPLSECPTPLLGLETKDDNIVVSEWHDNAYSDAVREQAYLAYYRHDEAQENRLHRLLDHRQNLATSLGFNNYSEMALQNTMAGSPAAVKEFLLEVHSQLRPLARWEYYQFEISKLVGSKYWKNYGSFKVNEVVVFPWDTHFIGQDMTKFYIKSYTSINYPNLPDFLSVGSVIEQIGVWLEDTYGVTLIPEIPFEGELWSEEAMKLAVEHETEGLLGFLYLDLYETGKRKSAPYHHVIKANSSRSIPISIVECNYHPSDGYRPPFLDFATFEKLFQELGSAIHSMLGRTELYQSSVSFMSRDSKLVTKYLHGNLARHPGILHHVMKHHTRKRVLPRVNYEKLIVMVNALNIFKTHATEEQLFLSILDQSFHTRWPDPDNRSSTELYSRVLEKYTHLPFVEGTAPHLRFTPLYTQGAQYYSHLWCKALANILYDELFIQDPFSRHSGEYFREHFLKLGASRNPKEMVEYLIGSKITPDRLAAAIVKPLELSQNYSAESPNKHAGKAWSSRISESSPLVKRLASSHPHLVTAGGDIITPGKFPKQKLLEQRLQESSES